MHSITYITRKGWNLGRGIVAALLMVMSMPMMAQTYSAKSPDGKVNVEFNLKDGRPTYGVQYDGRSVIEESPLGLVTSLGDLSQGFTSAKSDGQQATRTTSYTLDRSKVSQVSKPYNTLLITLQNSRSQQLGIEFRIENNDIAFRYQLPNQPDKSMGKKFSVRVMQEKTGFRLPAGTTTFLSPQSDAMIGWKGTKPSYEEEYKFDEPMTSLSKYKHGYTFPCLFKEVPQSSLEGKKGVSKGAEKGVSAAAASANIWLLISETGVDSRYCGSHLSDVDASSLNGSASPLGGLYTIAFPMPEENNGNGTIEPAFALPGSTPWRTITLGTSLAPIVETTIPWDFVEPRIPSTHTYKYGKGTWSWIVWQDNSICWNDQVRYIELAKQMGYQYVLIDNWWDNNIGKDRMTELVKYARTQGVEVFLWYSSSGWWNDIEQGPINIMSDPILRKQYMRWMHEIGVRGIKVDFFGGDKQETMRLYEQILSDADDNELMVIFHGCTLPRGWERMYPNYVGSEAVLASENIYFEQHFCDVEAQNTALHPFCRNTVGCMEFGGCFMNRHLHRGNRKGNTRRTTDCHELATTILFQNPIQNFALTPENLGLSSASGDVPSDYATTKATVLTDKGQTANGRTTFADYNAPGAPAPALCMDFLRQVPTTWDETRFLDGYPGKYCVMARRHAGVWYLAGNNATGTTLTLKLSAKQLQGILAKGDAIALYTDDVKTREPQLTNAKFNGKQLSVTLADQGGFVIVAGK